MPEYSRHLVDPQLVQALESAPTVDASPGFLAERRYTNLPRGMDCAPPFCTYAQRLIDAGMQTELHLYPGAFHGFNRVAEADVTKRFERDFESAFGRRLQMRQTLEK